LRFFPLNQLHEVVTWNAFQLTGVPCSFVESVEPIRTAQISKEKQSIILMENVKFLQVQSQKLSSAMMKLALNEDILNPIEMVWDELDRKVKKKQPTST
jgi:hypothetical protein